MWFFLVCLAVIGTARCQLCNDCSCIPGKQPSQKSSFSVPEAFKRDKITPDYLPVPPKDFLTGPFVSADVNLGNFISPLRAIDPLLFQYDKAQGNKNYTLVLIDIDAPVMSKAKGFVNLLVVNIPGVDSITTGDLAVPFSPAMPSLGSGMHRVIGLFYEQEKYIDPDQIDLLGLARTRLIPQINVFTQTYGLGDPVAGNFFKTELSYYAIVIAGFCMDFNLDHSIHGETVTSRIVWTSNIVLGTVITCVGAYGAPNRLHDVISALNKIEKVKCQVKGANQDHTEKKHIISLLAYLGMVTVLIIADLYKDTCEEIEFGHHVNLIVMNSFFSLEYFVHELIVIQFTLIAAQVQHIFVEVNEKLQDIKDNLDKQQGSFEPPREIKNKNINSVIDSLYLKDTEKDLNGDYKTIRSLAHSYEAICDIVEKIGCSHKVLNLCLLTSSFLHLVVTPYYDIFTNIYALIRKPSVLLIRIVWFYVHLFNLGLLVEPWHQIQVQIMGAVTTYLVIIFQFRS
ncbi:unnamed protein product [Leptosia nina]|uniref:Gustatory receptor n=1 Tax=Leptosia nina TaxID=320188 RepID=A0AAV1IWE5_9NEOP